MMDALKAYKKFFAPSEGMFGTLLYDPDWRLDLVYDVRYHPDPTYSFVDFSGASAEQTRLDDDEVYGFLKARFPERDIREEIVDEVKMRVHGFIEKIS